MEEEAVTTEGEAVDLVEAVLEEDGKGRMEKDEENNHSTHYIIINSRWMYFNKGF